MYGFRLLRLAFWLLLVAVLVVALMPGHSAPTVFASDKLNHLLAFFVLATSAKGLWPRTNPWVIIGFLAAYGGLIEVLQWGMGLGRDADWRDLATDIFAIFAGLAAVGGFGLLFKKLEPSR